LFDAKIEIFPKTVFIESPDYHYTAKKEINLGAQLNLSGF